MTGNEHRESTNVRDMRTARERVEIDVSVIRNFLHGGREKWNEHDRLVRIMSRDPAFDKAQRLYMTRSERYENSMKMMHRLHELIDVHGFSRDDVSKALGLTDEPQAFFLHLVAFEPVVLSQATPEFLAKYGELIVNRGIIGCYLQTELAHGSNVAGLETTATYLPEERQFEIHSPSLTSSKWWIGGAGKTATHGVVQAKLILPGGKDVGPHLFFVQLRSFEDHNPLPGIIVGDIGPKAMYGSTAIDNGYVRFNHVRIPAENMLSKFSQVTEDGRYVQPPHAKIAYGGMLYIRSSMITSGGWTIAKAATIAIRYVTVRRQGNKGSDGLEQQIITYPSVYNRLLPILSRAYAFLLLGRNLEKAFATMTRRLASGDTSLLAEMHATTSGLKILVTTAGVQDIETSRRALGGHGYSAYAGLGRLYADYLPSATYEGDNFLLDLQVVRAALKAYRRISAEGKGVDAGVLLSPSTAYLHLLTDNVTPTFSESSWQDTHACVLLLELRAIALVRDRAQHDTDADASADQRVSRAVTEAFVAEQVETLINSLQSELGVKEAAVVRDLLHLCILSILESALADLLSYGLLSPPSRIEEGDASRPLRKEIQRVCLKLLPRAIGLTDAFGFTDWELDSALGVYDGNVYEALWDKVQTEPLNRNEVADGYEEYIKPVLLRGQRLASENKAKL